MYVHKYLKEKIKRAQAKPAYCEKKKRPINNTDFNNYENIVGKKKKKKKKTKKSANKTCILLQRKKKSLMNSMVQQTK